MIGSTMPERQAASKPPLDGSGTAERRRPLPLRLASSLASFAGDGVHATRVFSGAGLVSPIRPDKLARIGLTFSRWGTTPAAGAIVGAIRYPDEPALIDELGKLTFEEVHRRTNALARALSSAGIGAGDGVAIMCRDHRGFIDATIASSKLGASALYLNTAFAGPQLEEIVEREKPLALIHDEEFSELLGEAGRGRKRFIAWSDGDGSSDPTLEELISSTSDAELDPPPQPGRFVILTSGTTGTPKGAQREPPGLWPAVSFLSRIPLRRRETTMIAAPLFHSWGFAHFSLGLLLSSTYVLRRKFDPEAALEAVARTRATALVVVPVMLQRILELRAERRRKYDTSSLRIVAASGSSLPGELAVRFMDEFGDILYNLYGSTEVAFVTIADPAQLRAAPGTAGTPSRGTILKILDERGDEVPPGVTGRIFVANELLFEGYTGGGGKEVIRGLMSTGDLGHIDGEGRLFVEGRDDEMIVSGGENVFPREVEDLLAKHEAIADVAVIGVDDSEFGQRLKAFVVKDPGARLTADEVKDYVRSNLARFKVPRDVAFVDELPRNPTGKILKRELV
jgi:acyl-CoA synthetase (AMP-forming)/AMP-acid ligase II